MENPFNESFQGNFSEIVRNEFKGKKTGDVFSIKLNGKDLGAARATIKNTISRVSYRTKYSKENNALWIKID